MSYMKKSCRRVSKKTGCDDERLIFAGFDAKSGCFIQSYESGDLVDSSILIAPLVFFISPNDPRFLQTIDRILLPPEKGGLTSTGLVYRYNTELSHDGKSLSNFV